MISRLRVVAPLILATALLLLASPVTVAAQDGPPGDATTWWGFAALGIGATESDSTFYAAGIGGAVQLHRLVLLARIASVGPEEENRMEDRGALVGYGTRPGRFHAFAAGGLGIAHDSRDRSGVAVPVEAQVAWRFSRYVGLGLRGFLSLNDLSTFGGVTLAIQAGRLR